MAANNSQREIEILRARQIFENEQMHKRLTWLGQFESILFAALGVALNAKDSGWLVQIIAWLGLAISIQGIVALCGVTRSFIHMQNAWFARGLHKEDSLGLLGIYDGKRVTNVWVIPWPEMSIPIACAGAWIAVLLTRCLH